MTACMLFTLVGIGYLFPFSALTQPVDYWKMLFPDHNIEFALTFTYMYSNLAFLSVIVVFCGTPSYTRRIVGGLIGQLLVLIFIPTSYFFISSQSANTFAVLGGTSAAAIATAFIDSATIALVSQFPLRVQERFQLGVGLSAFIGSLYRDLTKLVFPQDQLVASTLIYFYAGALTIGLCIAAYFKLMRLQLSKDCVAAFKPESLVQPHQSELSRHALEERTHMEVFDTSDVVFVSAETKTPSKWTVLRKVLRLQLLVALVFIISLSLWPPLVTEIKTHNFPHLQESGWWSLILLTIFAFCDCVGRFMAGHRFGLTPSNIWIVVVGRIVLIPIMIGIVKEYWLTHDAWPIVFVAILGHTNGYLGTLTVIFVNESVEVDEQQLAGPFTSFFLVFGLVIGSTVGLLLKEVVLG